MIGDGLCGPQVFVEYLILGIMFFVIVMGAAMMIYEIINERDE